jgi:hypothetical protein
MRQRRSALGERQSFSHDDIAGTAVETYMHVLAASKQKELKRKSK